jgi:hypothetical protein
MRNLLSIILFASSLSSMAQSPQKMNYQAVARDISGAVLASTNICLNFEITDGNGGPVVYSELNQSTTTNQFGLLTWAIGTGNPTGFAAINWSGIAPWLQVGMQVNCTGPFTSMGSSQLLSVPYALVADKSMDNLWTDSLGNIVTPDTLSKVGIGTMTPSFKLDVNSRASTDALRINSSTNTRFVLQSNGIDKLGIRTQSNRTYFTNYQGEDFVFQDSVNTEIMRLKKSTHSVGIGTSSPLQMLEVAGGIRIGDATNTIVGSIRYNTNDFQGYTPVGWESFINHAYQSLLNYGLTSSTRNATVLSTDSIVVATSGIYLINFNVKGTNGQSYTVPASDYDQTGVAGVYKVGSGGITPSASIFEMYSDIGSVATYYRYVSESSSASTIQYLVAGDVLKAYAYIQAVGNPTGNWVLNMYQVQIIKIGNL